MRSIKVDLISLKKNFHFEVNNLEWEVLSQFLTLFDYRNANEGKSFEVVPLQRNSSSLLAKVQDFVEEYRTRYPQFNIVLHEFLLKIPEGHYFFILNSRERKVNSLNELWETLGKIHNEKGIESYDEGSFNWGLTITKYDIRFFGEDRKLFGNQPNKAIKLCRFCNTSANNRNFSGDLVKFSQVSHTVSEALGNKVLFSKDECDSCNERFSKTIEPSIVNFYAPFRSLYGIRGKGGMKALKGKNFTLHPEVGFNIQYPGIIQDITEAIEVNLLLNEKWVPQDIYRCLVKFIIGMLPSAELKYYQDTISWINGDSKRYLPKIAYLKNMNFYTNKPFLMIYKRIDNDFVYPNLIGEFRYGDIIMIFVIPLSTRDKIHFIKERSFQKFWPVFIGLRSELDWNFISFSSEKARTMKINFKLDGIKLGENTFVEQ